MTGDEADELSKFFVSVNAEIAQRLERGAERRQEVAAAVVSKAASSDLRVNWCRATMTDLVTLLMKKAEIYNGSQSLDRVQIKDLEDILEWTAAMLRKRRTGG